MGSVGALASSVVISVGLLTHCSAAPEGVREEQISFTNGDARLAGTIVWPAGRRRVPAVALLHGSGPQGRDLTTARWFAEQGLAALAYDKRGVGASTGDFRVVPFTALAGDGLAAVHWLQQQPLVDSHRVGLWGLSQGGWLGPLAASQSSDVAFVIAVSGPGVSPGDQMIFYYANQLKQAGIDEATVRELSAVRRLVWDAAFTGVGIPSAEEQIARLRREVTQPAAVDQITALSATLAHPSSLWITEEMRYDPVATLRQLRAPSLFVFGDQDELVPVPESIDVIRRTLSEVQRCDFTIVTVSGADHVLDIRGPDGERSQASQYLEAMITWLRAKVMEGRVPAAR